MSNAQHLAKTGEWYTNPDVLIPVRETFQGQIDLDPFSSAKANTIVRALEFWTSSDFPLLRPWGDRRGIFVNPPGTCEIINGIYIGCNRSVKTESGGTRKCTCGLPKKILQKCVTESVTYHTDLIYLAYSVNQLRHLSNIEIPKALGLTVAIPPKRIAYLDSETLKPVGGTPCDSAFICMSRSANAHTRFDKAFEATGALCYSR
jgi:hypothetical protein